MSKKKQKKVEVRKAQADALKKEKETRSPSVFNNMINWVAVLALVLPFVYSNTTSDPVITIRYLVLALFVLLFVLFFYFFKKTPINLPPSLLTKLVFITSASWILWALVSLQNAVNITPGIYETARYGLNLLLLFAVMQAVQKDEAGVLRLCKTVMIVSLFQGFAGICQYYGIAFSNLPGNQNVLPYGFMANRNLFGSAQVLVLPFTLFVLYKGKKSWRYLGMLTLAVIFFSLILSQTRSAWLAAAGILLGSTLLVILFTKAERKKWVLGALTSFVLIAALAALAFASDQEGTLSESLKQRALTITKPTTDTGWSGEDARERIRGWQKTIQMIKARPMTGVGVANWNIALPAYGLEGLVEAKGHYAPDRPHNVYLQVASETGIPGAVLFFGVWLLLVVIGFKTILASQTDDRRILVILLLAGLGAFATDCMFSFPAERIEHSFYFTLTGGILLGLYVNTRSSVATGAVKKPTTANKTWAVLFLLVAAFNFFLSIKKHNFEIHITKANADNKAGQYNDVIDETKAGKSIFVTVDGLGQPLELYSAVAWKELKDYDQAMREAIKARKYNPNSAMVYNNIGTIYTDMKKYDSAISNYLKALKLTPYYDIPIKNLAANYFTVGNDSACIAEISKIDIGNEPYLKDMLKQARERLAAKTKKDSLPGVR